MMKLVFVLMMLTTSCVYAVSIECMVLKEKIFNEIKYIEQLRLHVEKKSNGSERSSTPFADAHVLQIEQQKRVTSEAVLEQYIQLYKKDCE